MGTTASTVLGTLLRRLSRRSLVLLAAVTILVAAGRGLLIAAAADAASGDMRRGALLGMAAAVLYFVDRLLSTTMRIAVEADLHRMVARALLESDVLAVPQSDVSRTVYEGAEHALGLVTRSAVATVADGVVVIVSLPFLADVLPARAPVFALVSLVVAAAGLLVVRPATRRLEADARAAYDEASDTMLVAVEGRVETVACGGEDRLLRRLETSLRAYERAARRAAYGSALLGRAPLAVGGALFAGLCVVDPAVREALAARALEHAVVVLACLPAFAGFVLSAHAATRATTQVARFVDLLRAPARDENTAAPAAESRVASTLAAAHVSFGYSDALVLDDVSFEAPPCKAIILAGRNGAGKSTLLRLFLGLRAPRTGRLVVDGIELRRLDLRHFRRSVAYLPQRPYLGEPHATIRWSLALWSEDATDERMFRALDSVGLLDMLGREFALDRRIGELSAGQRQRVALARVLLVRDARIVLLDEPDANLDRDGVAMIASLVEELTKQGKSVAIAAHTPELASLPGCRVDLDGRA